MRNHFYLYIDTILTNDRFFQDSYLWVLDISGLLRVQPEVFRNGDDMPGHVLLQYFCSFDNSENQVKVISERSIAIKHKMELISIKGPLIDEEEEIVHDERISLGQFVDTFILIVEIDDLFESNAANDAIDVY